MSKRDRPVRNCGCYETRNPTVNVIRKLAVVLDTEPSALFALAEGVMAKSL